MSNGKDKRFFLKVQKKEEKERSPLKEFSSKEWGLEESPIVTEETPMIAEETSVDPVLDTPEEIKEDAPQFGMDTYVQRVKDLSEGQPATRDLVEEELRNTPATIGDLRDYSKQIAGNVQKSLTSLGGGGVSEKDVIALIESHEGSPGGGGHDYLKNVVEDTSPQLGGELDANGFDIVNLDFLRMNADGEGLRMTNVGALDNTGNGANGNFRVFATHDLVLGAGGNATAVQIDATTKDATFQGTIRVHDAYTLPEADGSTNQYLQTDGSGNISFADGPAVDSADVAALIQETVDSSFVSNLLSEAVDTSLSNKVVMNTNTHVYDDNGIGGPTGMGIADPDGKSGWYWKSPGGSGNDQSFQWRVFANAGGPLAYTVEDISYTYFVIDAKALGAVFINLYTAGVNPAPGAFKSRFNFAFATGNFPSTGTYLVWAKPPGSSITESDVKVYPYLPRLELPYDATFSSGDLEVTETIKSLSIQCSTGIAEGNVEFVMKNVGYVPNDGAGQNFDLIVNAQGQIDDAIEAINFSTLIDSDYIQARQAFSSFDSDEVNGIITHIVDSDYINTRVDITNPFDQDLNTTDDVDFNLVHAKLDGPTIFIAKNESGGQIQAGQVVYIDGISGNTPTVSLALASDSSRMPAFGIARETANDNAEIDIVIFGEVHGLDTQTPAFSRGDTLYVSEVTPGALVNTKPFGADNLIQNVGAVTKVHSSSGSIIVAGSGRTAAAPNLDAGQIFYGNGLGRPTPTALTEVVDSDYVQARVAPQVGPSLVAAGRFRVKADFDWDSANSPDVDASFGIYLPGEGPSNTGITRTDAGTYRVHFNADNVALIGDNKDYQVMTTLDYNNDNPTASSRLVNVLSQNTDNFDLQVERTDGGTNEDYGDPYSLINFQVWKF